MALSMLAPMSPAVAAAKPAPRHLVCCRVPAGTPVEVALVDAVGTKTQRRGDSFALRLAAPLVVDGRVVLRAGALGVGEVVESTRPSIGGKPAEMVLDARSLASGRGPVALDGLHLARAGHDNSAPSQVLGVAGLAFAPLGLVGIAVQGGDVAFQPGTVAEAKVAADITLPPLRRATRRERAAAKALAARAAADAQDASGPIGIPPPPPGQGQVVFFRPKSLMGTGQWFKVREAGKALGTLTNGAYFIQVTSPGPHTYTAKFEPELKDHLKLDVAAGETYFVEGTLTGGLVIGAADLSPVGADRFDKAAKDLKLATAPQDDKLADQDAAAAPPSDGAAASTTAQASNAQASSAPADNAATTGK